jgi:DNA polymerase-3 subunit delta'
MTSYPWLNKNILDWHQIVQKNRVPHAVLIDGSQGLGKIYLANTMAQIALCENLTDDGVCQNCKSCELIHANSHLDLIHIRAENSIIKIDQIRKLSQDVTLTTTRNQYKVIIIENAENLNKSSANALLKTLEEPPKSSIIILTSSDSSRLLATIKSRCLKLNVSNPSRQLSLNWLSKRHLESKNEDLNLSLILTNNAPLLADKILQDQKIIQLKTMIDDLYLLKVSSLTILEVTKKWLDDEIYFNLSLVSNFLMILIQVKLKLVLVDDFTEIRQYQDLLNQLNSHVRLLDFINTIHIFIKRLNTPLKKELLIEELLINWQNV